jgi:hypothetical protein
LTENLENDETWSGHLISTIYLGSKRPNNR